MPVFEYRATDKEGKPVNGTLFSATLDKAASDLAGRGLTVTHLASAASPHDPVEETPREDIVSPRSALQTQLIGPLVGQVSLTQLLFFFRQLATMLGAGVGIIQSLDTLSGQARDPRLQHIVRELSQHVREGRPMTAGLQRYPEVFSPLIVSLVRVGETSGMMDKSLSQIADYLEREIEIRNLVRRVTIYPKLVVAASILIILGANAILSSVGGKERLSSPLTTPATWVILAPLLAAAFLFFRVGVKNPAVRQFYDAALLYIPGIGKTTHMLAMAKFGRAFSALYGGGVPMPEAVKLSADACGSEELRARIYKASGALEEGMGITETFARTQAFSPIVMDMVRTGETTGNLDLMLSKVGEFYEDEAQTRSVQTAWILGVVCLLAVAVYVGYIVITFYVGHFSGVMNAAGSE
ncbi:MAG: type II secretion system F family protein [Fimbriimonadales bacterium]